MQAQRFPKNYDGIIAAAPAINWDSFLPTGVWGPVVMKEEKYYPPICEMQAIHRAAIEACDEIDGIKDGILAAYGLCDFDATTVVGQKFDCDGDTRKISKSAANIANRVWAGPHKNGKREWFGLSHEAPFASRSGMGGLVATTCDEKNKNCKPAPFVISAGWIRTFIAKDQNYDIDALTEEEFFKVMHKSRQWYKSILGTDDPDLSEFKEAGGKMITWSANPMAVLLNKTDMI